MRRVTGPEEHRRKSPGSINGVELRARGAVICGAIGVSCFLAGARPAHRRRRRHRPLRRRSRSNRRAVSSRGRRRMHILPTNRFPRTDRARIIVRRRRDDRRMLRRYDWYVTAQPTTEILYTMMFLSALAQVLTYTAG